MEGQVARRVAAAALAALVLAGACNKSSPAHLVASQRTASFRVLYRVVHSAAGEAGTPTWEVLTVGRPFRSSDLTYERRPNLHALGRPDSGNVTDVDHLYSHDGTTLKVVAGRQPGLGSGDQALVDIAPDAVRRGLARVKGAATVAGRGCTTVEFAEPPVGALAPLRDDANHDDICLTAGGVVLREIWTLDGRVVLTRQAVAFADVPADAFDTSSAEPLGEGVAVPRAQPMQAGVTPPPTPPGYASATAVDFFLPRADAPDQLAYASKVWAFTKGARFISVELGAGQVVPWNKQQDNSLRLGARATGSVVRSDGIEIHWTTGDHWVRVRGPMRLVALVDYARSVSNWDSSAAAVPK